MCTHMMKVSQNTNKTIGPHKRLYMVISVVEHGSWVQNLGCFKSYAIVNNQLFSQFDYSLGKGKVTWKRDIGLSWEV